MSEIVIIILLALTSLGLVGAYYSLNKDKAKTVKACKKIREEKINSEIAMLKNIKGSISPNASDDVVKNIMNSKNTLLENALKDDFTEDDVCKKLRRQ